MPGRSSLPGIQSPGGRTTATPPPPGPGVPPAELEKGVLESLNKVTISNTGFQEGKVQSENGKTIARLIGGIKTTEKIPAATVLFSLPPPFRPPFNVSLQLFANGFLTINAAGTATYGGPELESGLSISMDGLTWNLT